MPYSQSASPVVGRQTYNPVGGPFQIGNMTTGSEHCCLLIGDSHALPSQQMFKIELGAERRTDWRRVPQCVVVEGDNRPHQCRGNRKLVRHTKATSVPLRIRAAQRSLFVTARAHLAARSVRG